MCLKCKGRREKLRLMGRKREVVGGLPEAQTGREGHCIDG
jgi:hypothetical protein